MQEEVNNVQVEIDGGQDMLLGRELLHQQVGVVDDEAAEDQSTGSSKDQLCTVTVEKELKREQSQCEEFYLQFFIYCPVVSTHYRN